MGKMVGITEFKAKCLKLIDDMQRDGESLTITKRGRPVARVVPEMNEPPRTLKPIFGIMKGSVRWAEGVDPTASVLDDDWEEEWLAGWDRMMADDARKDR